VARPLKGIQPNEDAVQLAALVAGVTMPFFFRTQNQFFGGGEKQSPGFYVLLNHCGHSTLGPVQSFGHRRPVKSFNRFRWNGGATQGKTSCRTVHQLTILTGLVGIGFRSSKLLPQQKAHQFQTFLAALKMIHFGLAQDGAIDDCVIQSVIVNVRGFHHCPR
jgi:hypothetical protein